MKSTVTTSTGIGPVHVAAPGLRARYLGPLIANTSVPGERKSDGVIPAHPGGGALRVAEDRWVIFFATLNPTGSDCNRSILYQLRADAPDGPILRESVIDRGIDDWDPFNRGDRYVKSCGMPIAFGVPMGATHHGRPMANANVFIVKWYRWAHLRQGDRILHPSHNRDIWPDGLATKQRTLRIEWMQFRFNPQSDDIEPLTKPRELRQRGYESGDAYCSLGPDLHMNHAMKAPVPERPDCMDWVSCDTFTSYALGYIDHGEVAPVRFSFDTTSGLYVWADTGPRTRLPGRIVGEASVNKIDSHYIISLRCFEYEGRSSETAWIKTDNLFSPWGDPVYSSAPSVPRISFTCGDGTLRLFSNPPAKDSKASSEASRATLSCWDVDPDTLQLNRQRVLLDSRTMGWGFKDPVVDMAKLCPPQGRRQLLLFRAIDRSHTANMQTKPTTSPEAFALAGIHAIELTLPKPAPDGWAFEPRR